ncbi:MAG: hypothetical protein K0S04_301 [Herbinix sp.]|jgi:hypothetical protein|nr:hypothetical protein [Herbinix sp.]
MATKYQIKKFLEMKMNEALGKLKSDYAKAADELKVNFTIKFAKIISELNTNIGLADDSLRELIIIAKENGDQWESKYYSDPKTYLCKASNDSRPNKITEYFKIKEVELLKIRYEKMCDETSREYKKLIAVSQTMSAKSGIEYIKKLGFDTSNLEAVEESTALVTVIDAKKLFIGSEVDKCLM